MSIEVRKALQLLERARVQRLFRKRQQTNFWMLEDELDQDVDYWEQTGIDSVGQPILKRIKDENGL